MRGTRTTRPTTWGLGFLLLMQAGQAAAAERSIYFYGVQDVTEARWLEHLAVWRSEGIGRVIVSLEAGQTFLLEDHSEAQKLADLFSLACAHGIRIEGLIIDQPYHNAVQQDVDEVKPRGKRSKQFETQQKIKIHQRAIVVPYCLLPILREQRRSKDLSDIPHAMNIGILLYLRVVVINEAVGQRVGINQKGEQKQASQQISSPGFRSASRETHSPASCCVGKSLLLPGVESHPLKSFIVNALGKL